MRTRYPLYLLTLGCLSACSGDNNISQPEPQIMVPPSINEAKTFVGGLQQVGDSQAQRFLKNGIYIDSLNPVRLEMRGDTVASDSNGNFSTTNTHEAGVDEADRMEYDGEYLYVATYPIWTETNYQPPHIRVMQRQQDWSLKQVNQLKLDDTLGQVNGLYLYQDALAVISASYPIMTFARLSGPWYGEKAQVGISLYNTNIPAEAGLAEQLQIEGLLLDSRRIGQYLYVTTTHSLQMEGLNVGAEEDASKLQNYQKIQAADLTELMPKLTRNGQSQPLHRAEDCYIPELASSNDGYARLVNITRINLQSPDDVTSLCLTGQADNLYVSPQSLYLSGTAEQQTILHKVSLGDSFGYQASGTVDGQLGWQTTPYFRMSEKEGYLRIITSQGDESLEHKLTVMQQQGNALVSVATLPNSSSPEPIGKPGEEIYAVRFIGDRGYVVTFERMDPLYVLDLSNPLLPQTQGSLEIPGFSSYLHPLDNHYLLGIGQDVAIESLPGEGDSTTEMPVRQGAKISLFDINDPANPREIASLVKKQGYTPVEYNHRALSVLNQNSQYRFALPIEEWQSCAADACIEIWQPNNSLMLLDVNALPRQASLSLLTELKATGEQYYYGGEDRSVIHGDHIYYLHGNQLWMSQWQANAQILGPY
ncbi:beta-propeller domain-containing protein [Bowmanella denitrificans]|uniref:Beta-propeller domain-containing protein n=1 Tax=Bowmanella denitrificans TaxID=366582 RepID=A0ABP3GNG5_9ALTE